MHPSTIAAILAFTAGMAVNGAPLNPSSRPLTLDDLQYTPQMGDPMYRAVDKRDPQRSKGRIIGNIAEGIGGGVGAVADFLTIGGAVQGQNQKRDPQGNYAHVIDDIVEKGGVIGGAADLPTIGGAVQGQNQKRDPQRSKGRLIGNIGEGIGGVIGGVSDLITIGGAVQGQPQNQKRDPQRSKGRIIGNIAEGIGGGVGAVADFLTIGGAVQGQPQNQKRDPQRSKGRIIGNIAEGIGGGVGAVADFLTIGGAVQGQNQKRGLTVVDNLGQPVAASEPADYDLVEGQNEKRDPRRIGKFIKGFGEGVGIAGDLLNLGGAGQESQPAAKRGLTVVDEHGQPVVASESVDYDLPEVQNEKRDPQRGRRIGNFIKGFGEGVGIAGDLLNLGGASQESQPAAKRGLTVVDEHGQPVVASESVDYDLPEVQNEKRDPQRGRRIGNFIKGFGEGVGIAGDLLNLGGASQESQPAAKRGLTVVDEHGQPVVASESVDYDLPEVQNEKRDPQRGRRIGNFIKGFGEGVGIAGDLLNLGGASQESQPAAKRDVPLIADDKVNSIDAEHSTVGLSAPAIEYEKRDPQRSKGRIIGNIIEGIGGGVGGAIDLGIIGGAVQGQNQKRDPQRSRGHKIGKVIEGLGDGLGGVADIIQIGGAVQGQQPPQKRDPKRSKGHIIGNIIEGIGGAVGGAADLGVIGGAVQGQNQKREPQRSRGHKIGKVIEGLGDGLGGVADIIQIGGAVQGQQPPQKRDPQRSKGRIIGNVLEGIGGVVGGAIDLGVIGGAVQGQNQKRDPQPGRGHKIGKVLGGLGDGLGGFADIIQIGGAVQGQGQGQPQA